MTRKRRRKLSRRQFLKGSAAVGLAASLPGLLAACGADEVRRAVPPPTPAPGPRERRTLHFDLSHNGPIAGARLVAFNSSSYLATLRPHDGASRQRFRQRTPELNSVPNANLTHYLEDADLPADALQLVTVMGTTTSGQPALLGAYIHIPSATLEDYAARATRGTAAVPQALLHRYQAASTESALAGVLTFNNSYINPLTTAVALCFHHPEVMNLNTTLGANTLIAYIQNLPADCTDPTQGCKFVDSLAYWIATHSPSTTTPGGWATLVAQTYADGTPLLDENGDQVYRSDITNDTLMQIAIPVQQVLKAIFNDLQYEGSNWNATTGMPNVDQTASSVRGQLQAAQDDTFRLQATLPVGSTHNGIEFLSLAVADPTTRSVQLAIKNRYLRWLRAYAQYFTPEGAALPVANPSGDDTERAKFITEITSNNQIMGIPYQGNDVSTTCLDFQIPATASTARIFIGSLGLGGEAFCPEALLGSALTLAFNIGIPTLLLTYGIGETASSGISALAENPAMRKAIVDALKDFIATSGPSYGIGIYGSATSKDVACFVSALANSLISALLSTGTLLVQYLALRIATATAEAAVPVVGWILKGIEIAGSLAAIAVTVGEVLASQALTVNDVTLAFDIQVTIEHDPNDFRFPPEADSYEVTVSLDNALVYTTSGAIDPPGGQRTAPIVATITDIPSAGNVSVEVVLKNAAGWIAATAAAGPLAATPEAAGQMTLAVTNRLVPLTAQTQYQHDLELQYQGSAHIWVKTTQGPSATRSALQCAENDTLCQLSQITMSPRTGSIGYAWRTGGLGVGECSSHRHDVLYAFQNIFGAAPPDGALKFPGCGFMLPAGLSYDPQGPPNGIGRNFYFEPAADADGYYLRSVVLDDTTPFNLTSGMNWGRFTAAIDSVAVHPNGYVIGVSAAAHKIELLRLPKAPVPDAMPPLSPWATMRSGLGTRAGLVDTPVAVTVHKGVVLVLEQGNNRIQAFDVGGNPVNYFAGQTTPFATLETGTQARVRLDLARDALGYLYVLSYVGNGTSPDDYHLDIHEPHGTFLTRTAGVAAGRMTVDPFRTVYALNYQAVDGAPRIEPSVSQWIPVTPAT